MSKLPGKTLIPIYNCFGPTDDIEKAIKDFKEFMSDSLTEPNETLGEIKGTAITVDIMPAESYFSSNRYNLSVKELYKLIDKYNISELFIDSVDQEFPSFKIKEYWRQNEKS